MRYLPKSQSDRQQMLQEIGAASIADFFAAIPAEYRLDRDLALPFPQLGESEIVDFFRSRSYENASGYASFLGAGAYRHYRPVAIDALVQRGEFLTSYTPYQAEISQGTLQAIFEFQTMICELTGMDLANASMYDGSTGAAESVLMACRVTERSRVGIARTVHPEYRQVIDTYLQHQDVPVSEISYAPAGRLNLDSLEESLGDDLACVLIQSPNFFGCIEDVEAIARLVHAKGALLIVSIAEALSLGIVKPPREADIVSLEAQSFGVAPGYGGPYCGVLAAREKFIRQMPGRLVGQTRDKQGRRGFVLTLSTREQHIRREKATSNICTNQALVALMVTIYMVVYGKEGLRELAGQNLAKARYAADKLSQQGRQLFADAPFFNEFVVEFGEDPEAINRRLLEEKIIGGLPLGRFYPELNNAMLWCCTELNGRDQIDRAAAVAGAGPGKGRARQNAARQGLGQPKGQLIRS